jgi:nicotinamide mononucleotide transporter
MILGSIGLLIPFVFTHHTSYGGYELLAFIAGAFGVWLCVKVHWTNWPVGIINAGAFVYLFWTSHLYADMGINAFYVVSGLVGWYWWQRTKTSPRPELPIVHSTWTINIAAIGAVVVMTALFTSLLRNVNDIAPFRDGLTTALSIVGQVMLTRKIFENWFYWLTADVVYIQLYFQKNLALTGILYIIFLSFCLRGVYEWNKELRPQLELAA